MSKEMGQHIGNFKNFITENSTLSDITKFNKLSHEDKIKYLIDNFGMEKVEALEICPDGNTKVSDLPNEIKSQFGKSDVDLFQSKLNQNELRYEDSEALMIEVVDKIKPFYQKYGLENTIFFLESILDGIHDVGDEYFGK